MIASVDRLDLSENLQLSDGLVDLVDLGNSLLDNFSESNNLFADRSRSWSSRGGWLDDLRNWGSWSNVVDGVSDAGVLLCDLGDLLLEGDDLLSENWLLLDRGLRKLLSDLVDLSLDLSDDLDDLLFLSNQLLDDVSDGWLDGFWSWLDWERLTSLLSNNSDGLSDVRDGLGDLVDDSLELLDLFLDDRFSLFRGLWKLSGQLLDGLPDDNSSLDELGDLSGQSLDDLSLNRCWLSWLGDLLFSSNWSWSLDRLNGLSDNSLLPDQSSDSSSQGVDLLLDDWLLLDRGVGDLVSQGVDLLLHSLNFSGDFLNLSLEGLNNGVLNWRQLSWFRSEDWFPDSGNSLLHDLDVFGDLSDGVFQNCDFVDKLWSRLFWLLRKLCLQLLNSFSNDGEFVSKFHDSLGKSLDNLLLNVSKLLRIPLTLSHNKLLLLSSGDQSLGELDLFLSENSSPFRLLRSSLNLNVSFEDSSSLLLGDGDRFENLHSAIIDGLTFGNQLSGCVNISSILLCLSKSGLSLFKLSLCFSHSIFCSEASNVS